MFIENALLDPNRGNGLVLHTDRLIDAAQPGPLRVLSTSIAFAISPCEGQLFPLTKFVPWAAYSSLRDGARLLLEQDALFHVLTAQAAENADRISYDTAIDAMAAVESIELSAVWGCFIALLMSAAQFIVAG